MMKKLLGLVASMCLCFQVVAQTEAQKYLEGMMQDDDFASAQVGVLAVTASGKVLASWEADGKLSPASNAKLITTGLALNSLGAEYKFRTSLGYSGKIEGGILHGDLYIIGGGDPTLGSRDSIALSDKALFSLWKDLVSKAGISRIDGRIVGDGRCLEGPAESPDWLYEDLGTYYGTGSDGLCFYLNVKDFSVHPGPAVGSPAAVAEGYPPTPWMSYDYRCTTGESGTGDQVYLYTSSLAPIGELRGTFAIDRAAKTVRCSNKFGAYTCANEFRSYLKSSGIPVSGPPADIVATSSGFMVRESPEQFPQELDSKAVLQESLTVLGSVPSPSLRRIVYVTNQRSDNFYSEAMFRAMGKKLADSALYDDCWKACQKAMGDLGLEAANDVRLYDGSGLSRKDVVSPAFLVSFLRAMRQSTVAEPFINSLTTPGVGSQAGRMRNEPSADRVRITYKSGSMEEVRCYSGYIAPSSSQSGRTARIISSDDTIIFSVMVNAYTGPSWKLTSRLDHLLALLASCN